MKLLTRSIAAITIFASAAAGQVNVQWLQPSNGNWFDPLNWQQLGTNPPNHVVPNGPLDSAFINTTESSVVTLDSAATLDRFTLTAPNTLLGGGSLTTRTFDHTGMISGVNVKVTEDFNSWAGYMDSATLSLSGKVAAFIVMPNAGGVPNTSRIELHDRVEASQFYVRSGFLQFPPTDALITNHGTLLFTGTNGFTESPFRNTSSATVIAHAADFQFLSGVSGGGTFIAEDQRRIAFGGEINLAASTTVQGVGTVAFDGVSGTARFPVNAAHVVFDTRGAVNFLIDEPIRASRYLSFDRSRLAITKAIEVEGTLALDTFGRSETRLMGGALISRGEATIGTPGLFGATTLNGTELQLHGTTRIVGNIQTQTTAMLRNTGTIEIAAGISNLEGGVGSLINNGIIRGTGGIGWNVANHGTLQVQGGQFDIAGRLTGAGAIRVDQNATLGIINVSDQPRVFFESGTFECDGSLHLFNSRGSIAVPIELRIPQDLTIQTSAPYMPITFAEHVYATRITGNANAVFAADVIASTIDGHGYTFNGTVTASKIFGGHRFNGALTADYFEGGSAEFNGATNTFGSVRYGTNLRIDGGVLVSGPAFVERGATVNGSLHILGPVEGVELVFVGSGTTILEGPITLFSASPSTPGFAINGGTVVVRQEIQSERLPSLDVANATSRLFFQTSQRFRESRLAAGVISMAKDGNDVFSIKTIPSINSISTEIDLSNNTFIADYTTASPFVDIASDVFTGYANGAWNGPGIYSSVAGGNSEVGIGVAEASAIFSSFPATIAGETVDSTTVIARYTLRGDANLDRMVDIRDFALLAPRFNTTGFWHHGDFNYDFTVNVADFAIMAANFNRTMSFGEDGARGTAVPEPAFAAAVLFATVASRRRKPPSDI